MDAFSLANLIDSASLLPPAWHGRRFNDRVPAAPHVGAAPLKYALNKAVLSRFFRLTCPRTPDFGDSQHKRDDWDSVHQFLEIKYFPSMHRALVSLTKADVLYLLEVV